MRNEFVTKETLNNLIDNVVKPLEGKVEMLGSKMKAMEEEHKLFKEKQEDLVGKLESTDGNVAQINESLTDLEDEVSGLQVMEDGMVIPTPPKPRVKRSPSFPFFVLYCVRCTATFPLSAFPKMHCPPDGPLSMHYARARAHRHRRLPFSLPSPPTQTHKAKQTNKNR